jgi:CBS domain-containing protein
VANKAQRLLRSRRVKLQDIVADGLLEPGATLRLHLRGEEAATATVTERGWIRLADGREFAAPSPAASAAVGGASFDGWHLWRRADGDTLDHLRQQLLDQAAEDPDHADDHPGLVAALSADGRAWLKDVRELAEDEEPTTIRVSDLLRMWGQERRTASAVAHIEGDLADRGLRAEQDFRSLPIDAEISIGRIGPPTEPDGEPVRTRPPPPTGLTLGAVLPRGQELCTVHQDDRLETAITKMQLNGFSQLPVMSGRTLKGAVTWESIALARHTRPDAGLREAMVQPQSRRGDTHLLDVIRDISSEGFVVVEDATGRPMGVVTPADVAAAYDAFATPFSLIGDLDRLLRNVIDESMDWQDVLAVLDPSGERKLTSIDQFTFGDYLRAFENEALWQQLGWSVDRSVFREQLEAIRAIRNDVMHFNPDPPPEGTVDMLRRTQDLVRYLVGH